MNNVMSNNAAGNINITDNTAISPEEGVMIVDDSKFSRKILNEILVSEGFTIVAEAKNGLEAIEMAKEKKPKYVFLDVEMPVLDGLGALPKILEANPGTNVIMCTAMGQQNIIEKAARAGAKDYVLKPFKNENIINVMNALMISEYKDEHVIPFNRKKRDLEKAVQNSGKTIIALEEPEEEKEPEISLEQSAQRPEDLLGALQNDSVAKEQKEELIKETAEVKIEEVKDGDAQEDVLLKETEQTEKADENITSLETMQAEVFAEESALPELVHDEDQTEVIPGEAALEELSLYEAVQETGIEAEIVQDNAHQAETVHEEAISEEISQDETLLKEEDQAEAVKEESVQEEETQEKAAVQEEAVQAEEDQAEAVKEETVQAEGNQEETVKEEAVQAEETQEEPVKEEAVQAEETQEEAVKEEAAQAEIDQEEAAAEADNAGQENAPMEKEQTEAAREETGQIEELQEVIQEGKAPDEIQETVSQTGIPSKTEAQEALRKKTAIQEKELQATAEQEAEAAKEPVHNETIQETAEQEDLLSNSNNPYEYLWINRFDYVQREEIYIEPAGQRLSFHNVINASAETELDMNLNRDLLTGLIGTYLCFSERLQTEYHTAGKVSENKPRIRRISTQEIFTQKNKTTITMSELLKLAGRRAQNKASNLSKAIEILVQGKGNRTLV